MSSVSTRGEGIYQASQVHRALRPRMLKLSSSRRGVIALAGATGTADSWYTGAGNISHMLALVDRGLPTASLAVNETWGNATVRTRITNLRTYANSNLGFAGKVNLYASSMGATCALNWTKNNPTLVQSLTLTIPAVDIQDIYDNNREGWAASISTAHGGRPADAENPADNTASFTAFPMKIWYSTSDTICTPTAVAAFGSAVGAEMVSLGAVGHSTFGIDADAVADFIAENS